MKKEYKIPQKYLQWGEFSKILSSVKDYPPKKANNLCDPKKNDNIYSDTSYIHHSWSQGYPLYCVRKSLLEEMFNTDVGEKLELFTNIELAIPFYCLLFPKGLLHSPSVGDNVFINYLMISHEKIEHKEYSHIIQWCGVDSQDRAIYAVKRIRNDGTLQRSSFSSEDQKRQGYALNLRNVVLQSILLLQYYPNIAEEPAIAEEQSKGFSPKKKSKSEENAILFPRWLGNEKTESTNNANNASSTSKKAAHFRRGHWRKLEKDGQTKVVWVRPAWVNPNP